jgi:hypothetical protein
MSLLLRPSSLTPHPSPKALWELNGRLQDDVGNGVVFKGVGFTAQTQGFQRDASASCEGIQHLWWLVAEPLADESSGLLKQVTSADFAVVHFPFAQVNDELFIHLRLFGKQGAQHCGAGHYQRPSCPPHMQGGDMPMSDGFFAPCLFREGLNRQYRLNKEPLPHPINLPSLCARYRTPSF